MKVAFVGAADSGKTTLSALFIRFLAGRGRPVVAIDAGAGRPLGEVLDVRHRPPALTAHLMEIKEYLRGTNPRIASAEAMVETTPPGRGSWLLSLGGADPVHDLAVGTPCGARMLATGPFDDELSGLGGVGLYLNHLVDGPDEYVVVDCAADADPAADLFTRFDLIFVVTEPTGAGVTAHGRWASHAAACDVAIALVGTNVRTDEDATFLRDRTGTTPLACFGPPADDPAAVERGLGLLAAAVGECRKDWPKFSRQAARCHARYARSAGRAAAGALLSQIDPGFTILAPQRSLSR